MCENMHMKIKKGGGKKMKKMVLVHGFSSRYSFPDLFWVYSRWYLQLYRHFLG